MTRPVCESRREDDTADTEAWTLREFELMLRRAGQGILYENITSERLFLPFSFQMAKFIQLLRHPEMEARYM
jgi:hypothetical protein